MSEFGNVDNSGCDEKEKFSKKTQGIQFVKSSDSPNQDEMPAVQESKKPVKKFKGIQFVKSSDPPDHDELTSAVESEELLNKPKDVECVKSSDPPNHDEQKGESEEVLTKTEDVVQFDSSDSHDHNELTPVSSNCNSDHSTTTTTASSLTQSSADSSVTQPSVSGIPAADGVPASSSSDVPSSVDPVPVKPNVKRSDQMTGNVPGQRKGGKGKHAKKFRHIQVTQKTLTAKPMCSLEEYHAAWMEENEPILKKIKKLAYEAAAMNSGPPNAKELLHTAGLRVPLQVEFHVSSAPSSDKSNVSHSCLAFIDGVIVSTGQGAKARDAKGDACEAAMQKIFMPYLRICPTSRELHGSFTPFTPSLTKFVSGGFPCAESQTTFKESNQSGFSNKRRLNERNQLDEFVLIEPIVPFCSDGASTHTIRHSADFNQALLEYEYMCSEDSTRCILKIENVVLADVKSFSKVAAKNSASTRAIEELRKMCWVIKIKNNVDADVSVSKDDIISEINMQSDVITSDNIGNKMLRKMGWAGGGVGKNENGIQEPVSLKSAFNRRGFGMDSKGMTDDFMKKLKDLIRNYAASDNQDELVFSDDFEKEERVYLHEECRKLNLRSKSRGRGKKRQLVIQRKRSVNQLFNHLQSVGGEDARHKLIPPSCNEIVAAFKTLPHKPFGNCESDGFGGRDSNEGLMTPHHFVDNRDTSGRTNFKRKNGRPNRGLMNQNQFASNEGTSDESNFNRRNAFANRGGFMNPNQFADNGGTSDKSNFNRRNAFANRGGFTNPNQCADSGVPFDPTTLTRDNIRAMLNDPAVNMMVQRAVGHYVNSNRGRMNQRGFNFGRGNGNSNSFRFGAPSQQWQQANVPIQRGMDESMNKRGMHNQGMMGVVRGGDGRSDSGGSGGGHYEEVPNINSNEMDGSGNTGQQIEEYFTIDHKFSDNDSSNNTNQTTVQGNDWNTGSSSGYSGGMNPSSDGNMNQVVYQNDSGYASYQSYNTSGGY